MPKFKFGGGNKCATCDKTVYSSEEIVFDGKYYHDTCFKCGICGLKIDSVSKAGSMDGVVTHRLCFEKQMRTSGGKYGGVAVKDQVKGVAGGCAKDGDGAKNTKIAPEPVKEVKVAPEPKKEEPKKEEPKEEAKKEEPKKKTGGFKVAKKPAATEGKIDTSKTDKIFVDNFDGRIQTEPVVIEIPSSDKPTTGVFIDKCKGPNLAIMIKGKVKNITINNCSDLGVVFDSCVTTVEVIGCKKLQVQAQEQAGSYVVDKSDRTTLYLAEASVKDKVVIITCMSTATNVAYATADGEDMEEHGIPDQIESIFKIGDKPSHDVVIPDAE